MEKRVLGYFIIAIVNTEPSILEIISGVFAIAVLLYLLSLILGKKTIQDSIPEDSKDVRKGLDFRKEEEEVVGKPENNINRENTNNNNNIKNNNKDEKGDIKWKIKQ